MSAYQVKIPPGLHPVIVQLIQARRDQDMSQAELANRLGTTQTAVARWESGRGNPTFARLAAWAAALGLTLTTGGEP